MASDRCVFWVLYPCQEIKEIEVCYGVHTGVVKGGDSFIRSNKSQKREVVMLAVLPLHEASGEETKKSFKASAR